jgi:hypothetical protein
VEEDVQEQVRGLDVRVAGKKCKYTENRVDVGLGRGQRVLCEKCAEGELELGRGAKVQLE